MVITLHSSVPATSAEGDRGQVTKILHTVFSQMNTLLTAWGYPELRNVGIISVK